MRSPDSMKQTVLLVDGVPAAGDPGSDRPWEWSCLSRWCLKKEKKMFVFLL